MKWLHLILYFLILMRSTHTTLNNTSAEVGERSKRYLIYPPAGGLVKIIMGFSVPVVLAHKRSLGCAYNLQGQFRLPNEIVWSPATFEGLSRKFKRNETPQGAMVDETREFIYNILVRSKSINGKNGKDCLLRTICEVSQSPLNHHNGIFGEIIDTIFIPGTSRVDECYHEAQMAGISGMDCRHLYKNCPDGDGFLDNFLFS
uniref:Putative conserved secreted protein n=1 Tax=Lutzomyia longipalpis TaxID=7200 RepID=A0A1B0CSF0_LUTLO